MLRMSGIGMGPAVVNYTAPRTAAEARETARRLNAEAKADQRARDRDHAAKLAQLDQAARPTKGKAPVVDIAAIYAERNGRLAEEPLPERSAEETSRLAEELNAASAEEKAKADKRRADESAKADEAVRLAEALRDHDAQPVAARLRPEAVYRRRELVAKIQALQDRRPGAAPRSTKSEPATRSVAHFASAFWAARGFEE